MSEESFLRNTSLEFLDSSGSVSTLTSSKISGPPDTSLLELTGVSSSDKLQFGLTSDIESQLYFKNAANTEFGFLKHVPGELSLQSSSLLTISGVNLTLANSSGSYTWPTVAATTNQVLSAGDPVGTMKWVDQTGGTPVGPSNAVQFNNGGSFGGEAEFSWEPSSNRLLLAKPGSTTAAFTGQPPGFQLDYRSDSTVNDFAQIGMTSGSLGQCIISMRQNDFTTTNDNFFISYTPSTGLATLNNKLGLAGIDIRTEGTSAPIKLTSNLGDITFRNSTGTVYTWPTVDATANQVLSAGSTPGTMKWVDKSGGGGTPGGTDRMVQYNNSGSFGGDAEFVWDPTGILTPLDPIKRFLVAESGATTTGKPVFGGANPFFLDIRGDTVGVDPTFVNVSSNNGSGLVLTNSNQDIQSYLLSFGGFLSTLATPTGDLTIDAGTGPPLTGPRQVGSLRLTATDNIIFTNSTGTGYTWPTTNATANQVLSAGSTPGNMEWVEQSGEQSSGLTEGIVQLTDGSGGFTSNSGLIFETIVGQTERLVVSSLVSPDVPTAPFAPYNLSGDFLLDVRSTERTFASVSGGAFNSEEGYLVYGGGNFRAKFSYINVDSGNTRDDAVIESTNSLVLEWQYTEQAIVKEARHRLPNTTPTKNTNIISSGSPDIYGINNCEWIDRDSSFEPLISATDRSAYIQLNGLTSDGGLIPEFTPNNEFSNRPNFRWDPAPGGASSDTTDRLLVASEGSNVTRFTPSGSVGAQKLAPFMLDVRNIVFPSPPATTNQGDCYINIGIIQSEKGGLLITNENQDPIASLLCNNGTTTLNSESTLNIENSGNSDINLNSARDTTLTSGRDVNLNATEWLTMESTLKTTLKSDAELIIENVGGSYTWPEEAPKNDGASLISDSGGSMQWSEFNQNLITQITVGDRIVKWSNITSNGFPVAGYENHQIISLDQLNRLVAIGAPSDIVPGIISPSLNYSDDGGQNWILSTNGTRVGNYAYEVGPKLIVGEGSNIAVVYGRNSPDTGPPDFNGATRYSIDGGVNFLTEGVISGLSGGIDWKSLKFINGIVVVVGFQYSIPDPGFVPSTICWSTSGGKFWAKTLLTNDYIDIEYGADKYVAISTLGLSYASSIAGPWTDTTTPANFLSITYADKANEKFFLAVSTPFTFYKSTDGINWSLLTTKIIQNGPVTASADTLKYIPEIATFVASSSDRFEPYFYYSFDTITWYYSNDYLPNIEFSSFIGGLVTTQRRLNTTGDIKTNSPRGTIS